MAFQRTSTRPPPTASPPRASPLPIWRRIGWCCTWSPPPISVDYPCGGRSVPHCRLHPPKKVDRGGSPASLLPHIRRPVVHTSRTPPGVACCNDAGTEPGVVTLVASRVTCPDCIQGHDPTRQMSMVDVCSTSKGGRWVQRDRTCWGSLESHVGTD